jgi:hypothetical protein
MDEVSSMAFQGIRSILSVEIARQRTNDPEYRCGRCG